MKLGGEVIEKLVIESNQIEGIHGLREDDFLAFKKFISLPRITQADMVVYVDKITGGFGCLRRKPGMDVKVGSHKPPPGGWDMPEKLDNLLAQIDTLTPWAIHCAYEDLHPFMDGNGRSGRVLWTWMMIEQGKADWLRRYGFLQSFYYQTLSEQRK